MESILTSIKKLRGITEEDKSFDPDIIVHVNSVFAVLNQLGVGPDAGFSIADDMATWNDYLPPNHAKLELVKSYMNLKVWLLFDPPTSSATIEAINRQISEFEWRIVQAVDSITLGS